MAFITFSGLVSSAKGKLNGSYFQSQKGGTQIKTVGTPLIKSRVGTGALQQQKALVASVSQLWKTLSPQNRNNWASLAATLERVNKNGTVYTPSAYQIFCEYNLYAFKYGAGLQSNPNNTGSFCKISEFNVILEGGEFKLKATTVADSDSRVLVFASACVNRGVSYPRGGYKLILNYTVDTSNVDYNMQGDYENMFGQPRTNTQVYFKLVLITENGRSEGAKLTKADAG